MVMTGEGFFSEGARLGGSHGVPQHIGRIKALEAAEKRLGSRAGKSMREVLLEVSQGRGV
jgi:hypothetical protein